MASGVFIPAQQAYDDISTVEETELEEAQVQEFLESWGVTTTASQDAHHPPPPKRRRSHPPFPHGQAYPGFQYSESIRFQYIHTLVSCMRHFNATTSDHALAAVLATLLQVEVRCVYCLLCIICALHITFYSILFYIAVQHQDRLNTKKAIKVRNVEAYSRQSEVLLTTFDVLRRHPTICGHEILERLLRRAVFHQFTPEAKAAVGCLLADYQLHSLHHPTDAYDTLLSLSYLNDSSARTSLNEYERLLMLARIRTKQWKDAMAHGSRPGTSTGTGTNTLHGVLRMKIAATAVHHGSDGRRGTKKTNATVVMDRNAKDLCESSKLYWKTLLKYINSTRSSNSSSANAVTANAWVEAGMNLIEIDLCTKSDDAAGSRVVSKANALCDVFTFDTDAQQMALSLILAYNAPIDGMQPDVCIEAMYRCCDAVMADAIAPAPALLRVLCSLCRHHLLRPRIPPPPRVIEALCHALDATPPLYTYNNSTTIDTWNVLAELLVLSSFSVLASCGAHRRRRTGDGSSSSSDDDDNGSMHVSMQVQNMAVERQIRINAVLLNHHGWWHDAGYFDLDSIFPLPPHRGEVGGNREENERRNVKFAASRVVVEVAGSCAMMIDRSRIRGQGQGQQLTSLGTVGGGVGVGTIGKIEKLQRRWNMPVTNHQAAASWLTHAVATLQNSTAAVIAIDETTSIGMGAALRPRSSCPMGAFNPDVGFVLEFPDTWWQSFPSSLHSYCHRHHQGPTGEPVQLELEPHQRHERHDQQGSRQREQRRVRFTLNDDE